jgi:2-dehydro-3-deoxyphosphooctonate aldolase (KDO 8-P synthase)
MQETPKETKKVLQSYGKANPFWIAGPCVLEARETVWKIAKEIADISHRLAIPVVFKASFDKANRTSVESFRGEGMKAGLQELLAIKKEFGLRLLTDIHDASQAAPVAEIVDILQIPAFLCRQTDLLEAACRTGKLINVKKGQFLSPSSIKPLLEKLNHFGSAGHWITERGVSFGYHRLVVDFAAFPEIESYGADIILDITHSVQLPSALGNATGGIRDAIPYLAKAGAAIGVSGFFAETHPQPEKAFSDGPNAWPLDKLEGLIAHTQKIARCAHGL